MSYGILEKAFAAIMAILLLKVIRSELRELRSATGDVKVELAKLGATLAHALKDNHRTLDEIHNEMRWHRRYEEKKQTDNP